MSSEKFFTLAQYPANSLFQHVTFFNITLLTIATFGLAAWIFITRQNTFRRNNITDLKINLALLNVRFWTGLMLILSCLGALPKDNIPLLQEPTLFAPDLLIHNLPTAWQYLQWIELGLGVWILMGLWIRVAAFVLSLLIILSLMLYGTSMMYYCGFYFAISFFLLINGGGEYSVYPKKIRFNPHSLIIAQYLTGLNFIYSAIVVKWFAPAVDIYLLEKTKAFTFGLAYDTFVFIMLITEILFGLLLILGRQLRVVSIILLSLFIFLSFNLSENLFSHSFIYGLLSVFIILEGYPQKIFTTR